METRPNRAENDPNAIEIDQVTEKTNKNPHKHKLTKKQKEWSNWRPLMFLKKEFVNPTRSKKSTPSSKIIMTY